MTGEVGMNGVGHEREGVATLLAAGFDDRQHRLHEATTAFALRSERQLSPNDGVTQGTLAAVVGRFHVFMVQIGPEPLPMVVQFVAHAHQTRIAAEGAASKKPSISAQ